MFGTFFTLTASDTADVILNAKNLITDVTPLLVIVIGVAVGIFIFVAVVNAIKQ